MSEPIPDPPPLVSQTGTCHTEDCANAGIPITMQVPEGTAWTCGACGQPITDLT